jgi:hypothetical protein
MNITSEQTRNLHLDNSTVITKFPSVQMEPTIEPLIENTIFLSESTTERSKSRENLNTVWQSKHGTLYDVAQQNAQCVVVSAVIARTFKFGFTRCNKVER